MYCIFSPKLQIGCKISLAILPLRVAKLMSYKQMSYTSAELDVWGVLCTPDLEKPCGLRLSLTWSSKRHSRSKNAQDVVVHTWVQLANWIKSNVNLWLTLKLCRRQVQKNISGKKFFKNSLGCINSWCQINRKSHWDLYQIHMPRSKAPLRSECLSVTPISPLLEARVVPWYGAAPSGEANGINYRNLTSNRRPLINKLGLWGC